MAAIAAEAGFDGIDLTVREGGHISPARVQDDLPRAAEIVRGAQLQLPMITTDIRDITSPHVSSILKSASALGIRYYRWGDFRYSEKTAIPDQLAELKPRVRDLAALNQENRICGIYHTHSGRGRVGASIWDLWMLFRELDSRYIGINYDIGHATVEGGDGGWIHSARLTAAMMRGVAVKDFRWERTEKGRWHAQWCPLGQGMVDLRGFLAILSRNRFAGPVQLHFEYPELGGAETGKTKITVSRGAFVSIVRRDLRILREGMRLAWAHQG